MRKEGNTILVGFVPLCVCVCARVCVIFLDGVDFIEPWFDTEGGNMRLE